MADFWEVKRRSLRISKLLFLFTFVFTFASLYLLVKILQFFSFEPKKAERLSSNPWLLLLLVLFALGVAFFMVSRANKDRIMGFLRLLKARKPDLKDLRHRQLQNVVEEIAIAAGVPKPEVYVIPTLSKNAFSAFDIIAVTEGLVGLLDRDEMQAVVAHEMAHYVNGDSFFKGVIAAFVSLFTGLAMILLTPSRYDRGYGYRFGYSYRNERAAEASFLALFLALYLGLVGLIIKLLFVLISRQRELAADAAAVQYTRNPLALASALWKISRDSSTGVSYMTDPAYSCLFIINPKKSALDEGTGFFSEAFSTHPPTELRIKLLLQMAGEKRLRVKKKVKEERETGWYVKYRDNWVGPFSLGELVRKTWFNKRSLLRSPDGKEVRAFTIWGMLEEKLREAGEKQKGAGLCPRCGGQLYEDFYEDAPVQRCRDCGGVLLKRDVLIRILAREDYSFTKAEEEAAKKMMEESKKEILGKGFRAELVDPSQPLRCPSCGGKMMRRFYSYAYPIPVDVCLRCDLIFFDSGELELLQAAIERMKRLYGG